MKKTRYFNKTKKLFLFLNLMILILLNIILINPSKVFAQTIPTSTATSTLTPTSTPIDTLTYETATPSATDYAMPESGFSLPTILGITIGMLLIFGSILLAL